MHLLENTLDVLSLYVVSAQHKCYQSDCPIFLPSLVAGDRYQIHGFAVIARIRSQAVIDHTNGIKERQAL